MKTRKLTAQEWRRSIECFCDECVYKCVCVCVCVCVSASLFTLICEIDSGKIASPVGRVAELTSISSMLLL